MVHVLCSESKSVDQLCSDLIYTYAKDRLSSGVARMSHVTRKPVFGVSDQVRHKLDCTVKKMARDCTYWIKEEEELYYICCQHIGADQLCS